MHLVNRLDKVTGRFKELTGRSFEKITEQRLSIEETIRELKKSIQELQDEGKGNSLQVQKLQSMLVQQMRNLSDLEKRARLNQTT